jgi:hypothetical protein
VQAGAGSGSQDVATSGSGAGSDQATNSGSAAGSNAGAVTAEALPAAKVTQVVLFVTPGTFEVWEDGKKVADSPESLEVPEGGKREVVLKAKGYKDKKVTINTKKKGVRFALAKAPTSGPGPTPTPTVKCTGTREDMKQPGPCRDRYCKTHGDEPACMTE